MTANEIWDRFWKKVEICSWDDCWNWTGSLCGGGYGHFTIKHKDIKAHRFLFEMLYGLLPDGLELDHLCRNKQCVNPRHLDVVTRGENVRRGLLPDIGRQFQLSKTHCPKGHPYDEQNTYHYNGKRDCRLCRSEARKRFKEKQKAEVLI